MVTWAELHLFGEEAVQTLSIVHHNGVRPLLLLPGLQPDVSSQQPPDVLLCHFLVKLSNQLLRTKPLHQFIPVCVAEQLNEIGNSVPAGRWGTHPGIAAAPFPKPPAASESCSSSANHWFPASGTVAVRDRNRTQNGSHPRNIILRGLETVQEFTSGRVVHLAVINQVRFALDYVGLKVFGWRRLSALSFLLTFSRLCTELNK